MKKTLILMSLFVALVAGCSHAEKSYREASVTYEGFQEVYNTCKKLNEDLCSLKSVDETDKMFASFSKQERVNSLKTNLNRWIEDYNGKSKMVTRSLWKSSDLPYQLSTANFNCY